MLSTLQKMVMAAAAYKAKDNETPAK